MKGTIVNTVAIIAGSGIGACLKRGIPDRYQQTVMHGLALSVLVIGLQMAFKTQNILVVIISLTIGSIIGEFFNLDGKLTRLGEWLSNKLGNKQGNISQGFITASLVFCVGAMAVVGSIQDGLTGDASTLYAKSMLDGVASIVFSSSMGLGVALSGVSVFIYQGAITLLAGLLGGFVSADVINELSAVGGVMIIAISLLMFDVKIIKVANMLPAIPVAVVVKLLWPA